MFRLALALGCTVRELGERLDAAELTEWLAFYALEPWGTHPADVRAALVAATIANVNRGKGQRAYKVRDFLPRWDERAPRQQRPEEIEATLMAWAEAQRRRPGAPLED